MHKLWVVFGVWACSVVLCLAGKQCVFGIHIIIYVCNCWDKLFLCSCAYFWCRLWCLLVCVFNCTLVHILDLGDCPGCLCAECRSTFNFVIPQLQCRLLFSQYNYKILYDKKFSQSIFIDKFIQNLILPGIILTFKPGIII